MTTSISNTILTGSTLKFNVDQPHSVVKLLKTDGSQVDVWGQTLKYAFAPQQSTLTVYFTPISGTAPVSASCVDGQGTTVSSTQQGGSAVLTLQRPANTGFSFDIDLEQESSSFLVAGSGSGSLSAGAAASARMVSAPGSEVRPGSSTSVSRQSGLAASGTTGPRPTGPGARLQTRLVLTTVEPPPDPDVRPLLPRS